jgi:tetratricopeptide (TPR) repeat protein
LSVSYDNVGNVLVTKGRHVEALRAYMAGKEIAERLSAQYPENLVYQQDLAYWLRREATTAFAVGRKDEAVEAIRRAAHIHAKIGETSGAAEADILSSQALGILSVYLLFAQKPEEAVEAAIKGLEKDPSQIWIYANLAHGHLLNGRYSQAEKIYLEHCADVLSDGRRFDQAVLDDFQQLRRNGIAHPDMEHIEKLLASRR